MNVDWNGNLEAVKGDRVVSVYADPSPTFGGTNPDSDGDYWTNHPDRLGARLCCDVSGNASENWRIRNVAEPAKPVRTAAEMLERMEALVRRATNSPDRIIGEEAKAIVAEMTPPVDPDIAEAKEIAYGMIYSTNHDATEQRINRLLLDAIKRGRELERTGK